MRETSHSKYKAKKTVVDGITFDSKKEAARYSELKLLERAGEVHELRRQVKFVLIPPQKENGKLIERECSYIADFVYEDKDGRLVVEDTKGVKTKDYIIKRKLMCYVHGIRVREV